MQSEERARAEIGESKGRERRYSTHTERERDLECSEGVCEEVGSVVHVHCYLRVSGVVFRVQDSGGRVQGAGCRVQGSGCGVQGAGFRV